MKSFLVHFLEIGSAIILLFLGCASGGPSDPNGSRNGVEGTSMEIEVTAGPAVVDTGGIRISIPEGLFSDTTQIILEISDECQLRQLPSAHERLSKAIRLTINSEYVSAPDSLSIFGNGIEMTASVSHHADPYFQISVMIPGYSPIVLYGTVLDSLANAVEIPVFIPLEIFNDLASMQGPISVEVQAGGIPGNDKAPIPAQLYRAELRDGQPHLTSVSSTNTGSNPPLILVHGWTLLPSSEHSEELQVDKLLSYWTPALEFLLTRSTMFDIYCVYYDEDKTLNAVGEEIQGLIEENYKEISDLFLYFLAHSMGGLVVRTWANEYMDEDRLGGLVTLDTPHHGSALANWVYDRASSVVPAPLLMKGDIGNLLYDQELPGSFQSGNEDLAGLNASEKYWNRYVFIGGSAHTTSTLGLGAVKDFASSIFRRTHRESQINDVAVEMKSQIPIEYSSRTFADGFDHQDDHFYAKAGEPPLSYALGRLEEMGNITSWVSDDVIAYVSEADDNLDIYIMKSDGTGKTRVTNHSAMEDYPKWSPDGSRIAFNRHDDGIRVVNLEDYEVTWLANGYYPSWAPDGTKFVFTKSSPEGYHYTDIYTMNSNGAGVVNITRTVDKHEYYPAWSPDGAWIAYIKDGDIYVMRSDGTEVKNITNTDDLYEDRPSWSPDGSRIAFCGLDQRDGMVLQWDIYIINTDGSNVLNLTNYSTYEESAPSWSPDGLRIAYTTLYYSSYGADSDIYTICIDGTCQTNITNTQTIPEYDPHWGLR